jgi:hypothetical protein
MTAVRSDLFWSSKTKLQSRRPVQEKAYTADSMSVRTTAMPDNSYRGGRVACLGCSDTPAVLRHRRPLLCRPTILAYNTATYRTPPTADGS